MLRLVERAIVVVQCVGAAAVIAVAALAAFTPEHPIVATTTTDNQG